MEKDVKKILESEKDKEYLKKISSKDIKPEVFTFLDELSTLKKHMKEILENDVKYKEMVERLYKNSFFKASNGLNLPQEIIDITTEKYQNHDPFLFSPLEIEIHKTIKEYITKYQEQPEEEPIEEVKRTPRVTDEITEEILNYTMDKEEKKVDLKKLNVISKLKNIKKKNSFTLFTPNNAVGSPRQSITPPNYIDHDLSDTSDDNFSKPNTPTSLCLGSLSPEEFSKELHLDDRELIKRMIESIKQGDYENCVNIIEKGIDINSKTKDQGTFLHEAVLSGNSKIVQLFISKGIPVDSKDQHMRTPLHMASNLGNREIILLLLGNGAKLNNRDCYGYSGMLLAMKQHHFDIISDFLLFGGDINFKRDNGMTALHEGMYNGDEEMVKFLLKQSGVKLNLKDQYGQTPLLKGCEKASAQLLYFLMKHDGIDYQTVDDQGRNIFHSCAYYGRDDFFMFLEKLEPIALVKYSKMFTAPDLIKSSSPLHLAIDSQKLSCVKSLTNIIIKLNLDLNVVDSLDNTPFNHAFKIAERTVLEYLPVENRNPLLKEKIAEYVRIKQFLVQYDKPPKKKILRRESLKK